MKKYYGHRITKRERAAVNVLYNPRQALPQGTAEVNSASVPASNEVFHGKPEIKGMEKPQT